MFEVLAYVYENYDPGESCPEPAHLLRKLSAVGFEEDEISDALTWLQQLNRAARPGVPQPWLVQPRVTSIRVYPAHEQMHLGREALGFIAFLESAALLPPHMREVLIEGAMAAPGGPVSLEDLKIIVLMVYWRFGQEPDALILDELFDDPKLRVPH